MLPIVYLNGQYVPKEKAVLHVADLAILRGFGIFDFFRYIAGKPHFIADHLDRFYRSAAIIDLEIPISREDLKAVVYQLISRNEVADGGIRFVLTGGYATDGYTPTTPNLVAMAYPFHWPQATLYQSGCKVMLHPHERQLPQVKSIDYLEGIRIQPLLRAKGMDYAFYVDKEGHVRESDRSNFMMVKDGVLITPAEDILLGITRLHLLKVARNLGIKTEERVVSAAELKAADEVIICSSAKGALSVTSIDGKAVADGLPGPISKQLMAAWEVYISKL